VTLPIPGQEVHGAFDFETRSEAGFIWNASLRKWEAPHGASGGKKGLKVVNSRAYAEHPSTRVLNLSYRLPGGPVRRWRPGLPNPQDLFDFLAGGGLLEAHNVMFERVIWRFVCERLYGWPSLEPFVYQLRCSMAKAHVNQLPGALGPLSAVLRLATRKDADGTRLLNKFSIPRNPTIGDPRVWIDVPDAPPPPGQGKAYAAALAEYEDGEKLAAYCDTDVLAEGEASECMYPMTEAERLFWWIDQEINWRGIAIDRPAVRDCIAVMDLVLERYGEEYRAITGLEPTQLEKTKDWLRERGVFMDTMDENAIEAALSPSAAYRVPLSPPVRRVLEIRQLTGSASVKKLYAMELQAGSDDRLHNLLVHHGARTGRPTAEGPQPLNLPRAGPPVIWCDEPTCHRPFRTDAARCPWCNAAANLAWRVEWSDRPKGLPGTVPSAVEFALEIIAHRSLELVEFFFGNALLTISGCLRGLFVAGPGCDLIASDYSAIEAVVIAELAGEEWRRAAFHNNEPIYLVGASKITGKSVDWYLQFKADNGAHHKDRQYTGKVSELACFSPETQVLTKRGYVAIVDVLASDSLWDGVEWVKHLGVVAKGRQSVLSLDGVQMTPTHKIICGNSWREAGALASSPSMLYRSLVQGSASLPWSGSTPAAAWSSSVLAALRNIGFRSSISLKGRAKAVARAASARLETLVKPTTGMLTSFRTKAIGAAFSTGYPLVSLAAARATPRKGRQITPRGGFTFTPSGGKGSLGGGSSSPIWSRWRVGTNRLLSWTGLGPTATTNPGTSGSSPSDRTRSTSGLSKKCNAESTTLSDVYDIAYAGPRNRFTIKTSNGHLIVHNCGFGGWIGAWRNMEEQQGITDSPFSDDDVKRIILAWRAASPAIVEFWGGQSRGRPWDPDFRREYYGCEGAVVQAILSPGQVFDVRGIKFQVRDGHLFIRLLSGRELTYRDVTVRPSTREYAAPGELAIHYWTNNTNPKYGRTGWIEMNTFGARVAENIVQGVAADILRAAIIRLRAAGYACVLPIYDEFVGEIPIGTGSIEEMNRLMMVQEPWFAGWPVKVGSDSWRGRRFRKG